METQPPTNSPTPPAHPRLASSTVWLLVILLVVMVFAWYQQDHTAHSEISYDFFFSQLAGSNVSRIEWMNSQQIVGRFSDLEFAKKALDERARLKPVPGAQSQEGSQAEAKNESDGSQKISRETTAKSVKADANSTADPPSKDLLENFKVNIQPAAGDRLEQVINAQIERGLIVKAPEPNDNTLMILMAYFLVPALLFFGLWIMIRRTRDQVMGGGILSGFAKSPAKRYETNKKPVTFADVAGLEGVKNDLQEIVEFLKNPEKFTRLGGRVPRECC